MQLRKLTKIAFTILIFANLIGCEAINDTLSTVNSTLGSVNSVLSGTSVSSQAQSSVNNALARAKMNKEALALFNDAKPTINKMLSLSACLTSSESRQFRIYSDPDHLFSGLMPQSFMHYHKSGCVDVTRITAFKKIANNTLQFTVYYTSPQSGGTVTKTYQAIKQPDGEWLFNFDIIA